MCHLKSWNCQSIFISCHAQVKVISRWSLWSCFNHCQNRWNHRGNSRHISWRLSQGSNRQDWFYDNSRKHVHVVSLIEVKSTLNSKTSHCEALRQLIDRFTTIFDLQKKSIIHYWSCLWRLTSWICVAESREEHQAIRLIIRGEIVNKAHKDRIYTINVDQRH